MKKWKNSLIILLFLLSAVCLLSLGMAWREYASQAEDIQTFESLAELVKLPEETTVPPTEATELSATEQPDETESQPAQAEPSAPKRSLTPIMEQNSECVGWLYIEGTAVDYPVMHTPDDPQKYLRKNFGGEYSVAGVPFLDYRCSTDTNLIIYGHNMKNGTMFSDLKKYLDKDFREQHPIIELETADGVRYFTVTEVVKTDIYNQWYDRIVAEDGTRCLILSTCYGSSKSGRLLVIAAETE